MVFSLCFGGVELSLRGWSYGVWWCCGVVVLWWCSGGVVVV